MILRRQQLFAFFFFNDTATTEIYTLSLHDALPILDPRPVQHAQLEKLRPFGQLAVAARRLPRSEEHTSELQSPDHLVCRLLLEKKKPHRAQSDTGYIQLGHVDAKVSAPPSHQPV